MRKWMRASLLTVPLAVGGLVYANSHAKTEKPQHATGYVCPITGEELPCSSCCPLNQSQQAKSQQVKDRSYVCPITGEEMPCSNCCPLNQSKASLQAKTDEAKSRDGCPPCPFCP